MLTCFQTVEITHNSTNRVIYSKELCPVNEGNALYVQITDDEGTVITWNRNGVTSNFTDGKTKFWPQKPSPVHAAHFSNDPGLIFDFQSDGSVTFTNHGKQTFTWSSSTLLIEPTRGHTVLTDQGIVRTYHATKDEELLKWAIPFLQKATSSQSNCYGCDELTKETLCTKCNEILSGIPFIKA